MCKWLLFGFLLYSACTDVMDPGLTTHSPAVNKGTVLPVLKTGSPQLVDSSFIRIRGQIIELGKKDILEYGHSWSVSNSTNSLQMLSTFGRRSNTGTFQTEIHKLEPGMTYFIQAYAISVVGTTFGEVVSIRIE